MKQGMGRNIARLKGTIMVEQTPKQTLGLVVTLQKREKRG